MLNKRNIFCFTIQNTDSLTQPLEQHNVMHCVCCFSMFPCNVSSSSSSRSSSQTPGATHLLAFHLRALCSLCTSEPCEPLLDSLLSLSHMLLPTPWQVFTHHIHIALTVISPFVNHAAFQNYPTQCVIFR